MRIVQIVLLVTLSFVGNTKCGTCPPYEKNNYLPAEIEVDEKGNIVIYKICITLYYILCVIFYIYVIVCSIFVAVEAYAVYNMTSKRVRRAGSFGSKPGCASVGGRCDFDDECCDERCDKVCEPCEPPIPDCTGCLPDCSGCCCHVCECR